MTVEEMKNLCIDLGLEKVTVRGDNIMFCCPYHGERNPSCGIHAEKEVGGCFACGYSCRKGSRWLFCLWCKI